MMNNNKNSRIKTDLRKTKQPSLMIQALLFCLLIVSCSKNTHYQFPHNADQRWVVVNYWASWCAPCRHEIPEFNQLANNHSDTIAVYGINFDELEGSALKEELNKLNITFEQLKPDYWKQFAALNVSSLPTTLIFNHKGRLIKQLKGSQTEKDIVLLIKQLQKTAQ